MKQNSIASNRRIDYRIVLALATLVGVGFFLSVSAFTYRIGFPLDDAFIHQTYARSLALAFKSGIPVVQGLNVVGMVVDGVSDVITLQPEQIKPAPEFGATLDTRYLTGLGTVDQRMIILVDIERLLSSGDMELVDNVAA